MIEGGEEEVISPFVYPSVFSSYLTAALFNSPKKKNKKTAGGLMGDQITFTFLPALLCAISVTLTCHFKLTLLLLCHVIIYLPRGGGGEKKQTKKRLSWFNH